MEFSNRYFEDEVKDGFYVPAIMKRNFASQLEVLNDIDRVCSKYGIKYFAEWGTMLGTIRHEGFIPWDDDLDIAMLRKDYTLFCKVAEEELGEDYYVLNWRTHDEYSDALTHVYNARHITFKPEFLEKYHGFPYMSGVDIFAMDYLPRDMEMGKEVFKLAEYVHEYGAVIDNESPEVQEQMIAYVEDATGQKINRNAETLKSEFMRLVDMLFGSFTEDESDLIGHFAWYMGHGVQGYPKEWFDTTIRMPFENTTIPVISAYDKALKNKYGNYMKSVKHTSSHTYPSYDPQIEMLVEETGKGLPEFHITEDMWKNMPEKETITERLRKEVVFYVFRPEYWNVFDRYYKEIMDDEDTDVYIIPVTYYHKDIWGKPIDENIHLEGYPEHVYIYGLDDYDIEVHHPDKVYIQVPYDQWNFSLSTHPIYYSERLRRYTDELIYIPFWLQDELAEDDECGLYWLSSYAVQPAVLYADKVILQSENMKKYYIEALVNETGEESRDYWDKKIECQKAIEASLEKNDTKEAGDKKQILVDFEFCTFFEYKDKALSKLRNVIDTFSNSDGVIMRWWVPSILIANMGDVLPDVLDEFRKILESAINSDFILVDNSDDRERAIMESDAYYGDVCKMGKMMEEAHKPVMIMDVEI